MSDIFITVIYHAMSLTVLYQHHQDEWYIYEISKRFIMLCPWLYWNTLFYYYWIPRFI